MAVDVFRNGYYNQLVQFLVSFGLQVKACYFRQSQNRIE